MKNDKSKKIVIFFLSNIQRNTIDFIKMWDGKYHIIIFTTQNICCGTKIFSLKKPYSRFFYLQWLKLLLLKYKHHIQFVFADNASFLPFLKIIKQSREENLVVSSHIDHPLIKKSSLKEFIALSDMFISNQKETIREMNIESSRFLFVENEDFTIPKEKIEALFIHSKPKRLRVKDIQSFFNISAKKAFNYYFFWWKQHYKPAPNYNYFLLLDMYKKRLNIDINPLFTLIDGKKPVPYTLNYIPKKSICKVDGKIALHIHLYHLDLAKEIYSYISHTTTKIDIFITTTEQQYVSSIRQIFSTYKRGKITITVIANRGRNIAAFLCNHHHDYKNYDYIGHIHTKKSAALTPKSSDSWRKFLFMHLLGRQQILTSIFSLFSGNKELGLLFPEDPRLPGWSSKANQTIAEQLMKKINADYKIPQYIEFPIGAMFWARYEAIAPLFELGLNENDFPQEPISIDGTIAHAIERILPCVCESSGFTWETVKIKYVNMKKLRRK